MVHSTMMYLFGNCQTGFLADALKAVGLDVTARFLSSPFTYTNARPHAPALLDRKIDAHGVRDFLHDRSLMTQMYMIGPEDPAPSLVVFNLFHETTPIFAHPEEKWSFYIDANAWEKSPEFGQWMQDELVLVKLDPMSYFQRFARMVELFRKRHPEPPIIILNRLSHYPTFGPSPASYLECWDQAWPQVAPALEQWAATIPGCHVIDMDRVFAGILAENPGNAASIDAHCPFLKLTLDKTDPASPQLTMHRDVEHIGSMWPRLAVKLIDFIHEGRISYSKEEQVPGSWKTKGYSPEQLDEATLSNLLSTGGNYDAARAIGNFFWHHPADFTDMLVAHKDTIPVCHNTFHMIRIYQKLLENPAILDFLITHRAKTVAFTSNGEAYQRRYLERVDDTIALAEQYG